jgi:aldehyde dehydrogenase (NAD+)
MSVQEIFENIDYGPAPESAAAVNAWLDDHGRKFGLFINNQWVMPEGAEFYLSLDPATGNKLADTTQAGQEQVDQAVSAARQAFGSWSQTSGLVRARHLYAIARNIQKHQRLLAVLESLDNGKPIRESRDIDVPLLARHFFYHAGWAQLFESELKDYQLGWIGESSLEFPITHAGLEDPPPSPWEHGGAQTAYTRLRLFYLLRW